MFVKDFADEYRRYRMLGEQAMAQVSDEGLNRVVAPDGNSIAVIVRHVSGNLISRLTDFLTSDGEKPSRDRDAEFVDGAFPRAEIAGAWERAFDLADSELAKLEDADLTRTVTIRGTPFTAHEALCRSIAHTAYHVGQIVLVARMVAPNDWKSLSIPRGESKTYNQNPTKEKVAVVKQQ